MKESSYEERMGDLIGVLHNLHQLNVHVDYLEKSYQKQDKAIDLGITQYYGRRRKFEQQLYILLLQLNAPSSYFSTEFSKIVEPKTVEETSIDLVSIRQTAQPYLKKIALLFAS